MERFGTRTHTTRDRARVFKTRDASSTSQHASGLPLGNVRLAKGAGSQASDGQSESYRARGRLLGNVLLFLFTLGWLPKLDLIAIWISNPRKAPVGIFRGLFDCHALTLKMADDFSQVLH